MTNSTFNPGSAFDDLEDESFWSDEPSENIRPFGSEANPTEMPAGPQFKERCDRCGGSGKFRGYTGRILGDCRACKGEGFKTFKTSGADRAKARFQATARKENAKQAWADANEAVVAWVKRRSTGDRPFNFAVSLAESLAKFGTLTDGQVAAVQKLMAQDAERDAARKAEAAQVKAAAPTLSVEPLLRAFAKASGVAQEEAAQKGGWLRNLKLRLGAFYVKPAPAHGKNPGALYVCRTGDSEYLGKLQDGRFSKSFVCTAEEQQAVVEACADPEAATVAYGRLTGACGVCGRRLDNHESIALGIGPICRAKMGWG